MLRYWLCVFDGLTMRVRGGTKRRERGRLREKKEKEEKNRKLSLHYYNYLFFLILIFFLPMLLFPKEPFILSCFLVSCYFEMYIPKRNVG